MLLAEEEKALVEEEMAPVEEEKKVPLLVVKGEVRVAPVEVKEKVLLLVKREARVAPVEEEEKVLLPGGMGPLGHLAAALVAGEEAC